VTNLRYIGSHDAVELDGVGVVARGDLLSVPTQLAGRKPEKRYSEAMDELVEAMSIQSHEDAARLRDEIVGLDPGEGLLAQTENWETVRSSTNKVIEANTDTEGDQS
jgi:hypothetical protein